jgi:hypothetical protein
MASVVFHAFNQIRETGKMKLFRFSLLICLTWILSLQANPLIETFFSELKTNADDPYGWILEFTTENGTFPLGQTDSVEVDPGDSTTITVSVNPDGIDGAGMSTLEFVSKYNWLKI